MVLSIRNKSEDLPLDFNFTKVAHFRATPARGKLLPDAEHSISISFEPKNLGQFSNEMQLEILKGVYKIPIQVQGNSNSVGTKGKVLRGPAAREKDFDPQSNHITDDDATNNTIAQLLKKKQQKIDPVLSGLNELQVEEKVDGIKQYLATKANKQRFNNVVKHQRL